MPVYLYRCECGHQEDVLHGINAEVRVVCDDCMKEMERKPSLGGVAFNGAGWASKE